jgi:hypothetical protein
MQNILFLDAYVWNAIAALCERILYMMIFFLYMMIVYHYMMILFRYMMIFFHYMMILLHYMMIFFHYMMILFRYMMILFHYMMILFHYMMILLHYMVILLHHMQEFFQIKRDLLKLSYKQESVTDGRTDRRSLLLYPPSDMRGDNQSAIAAMLNVQPL